MNTGKLIIPYGRHPEPSEIKVAEVFMARGHDVEFLTEPQTEGLKSADVIINGIIWEIKSPTGNNRRTIQRAIAKASKQSTNVIFDSRHSAISEDTFIRQLHQELKRHPDIKRLVLIGKSSNLLDIKGKF